MAYPDKGAFSSVTTTALTTGSIDAAIRSTAIATPVAVTDFTILCDTSAAGFTVTLPAAPDNGMIVNIKKISTDINTLTIGRNGNNIEGAAADLTTIAITRPNFQLQFLTASGWWLL